MRYNAKNSSTWAGETWSSGIRLWAVEGGLPGYDVGRLDPFNTIVKDAAVTRTITDWQVTQGFVGPGGICTLTDGQQDDIANTVGSFLSSMKSGLSNAYELDSIRIYPCGPDGKTLTAPSIYEPTGTTFNGTSTDTLPPDVSIAVSFGSATRGPSGRGRIFLGGLGAVMLANTGLVSGLYANNLKAYSATMLQDLKTQCGDSGAPCRYGYIPAIWTRTATKGGANANTASVINSVRVGDEFDTQKRRDRQRQDIYVSQNLA